MWETRKNTFIFDKILQLRFSLKPGAKKNSLKKQEEVLIWEKWRKKNAQEIKFFRAKNYEKSQLERAGNMSKNS